MLTRSRVFSLFLSIAIPTILVAIPAPSAAAAAENTQTLKDAAGKMEAGEFQEALDLYLDAIETDSDDWRPYQGAGNAYRKMGNDERALEYYKKALAIKGDDEKLQAKIEEMESAAEEQPEDNSGLKPIRGAETSNTAVAVRNMPKQVSAAGSFLLLGYGMGFPPNGKDFKNTEAWYQKFDSTAGGGNIPFAFAGDLTYAYVGKKDSKVGFRAQASWGMMKIWSIYASQYDYSYPIDYSESYDESYLFTGTKLGGDLLYRLGKSAFFFVGASFNSVKMKTDLDYEYYWNDITDGFPATDNVAVGTITATASGVGPRFGIMLIKANTKKLGVMAEFGYELGSVSGFEGKGSGDFTGDYSVGSSDNGIGFYPKGKLPSGVDEYHFHPGGFWFKFGLGINFGRPPVAAAAK